MRVRPARSWLGSSPLTRGKLREGETRTILVGLIPAHAGKTRSAGRQTDSGKAHPRSRGENAPSSASRSPARGSSPLTRGKQRRRYGDCYPPRLIPAHAGKTASPIRRLLPTAAHPRSRGENVRRTIRPDPGEGSSPLTRGKLPGVLHLIAIVRLIPAHAGKTHGPPRTVCRLAAHPRSRGENVTRVRHAASRWGSSPLTRGKRRPCTRRRQGGRLIPAHAGKTPPARAAYLPGRAHPRSRGENQLS